MSTDYPFPSAIDFQFEAPWYWALLNAAGKVVDSGQARDEASAMRHARRSALQRGKTFDIRVTQADIRKKRTLRSAGARH